MTSMQKASSVLLLSKELSILSHFSCTTLLSFLDNHLFLVLSDLIQRQKVVWKFQTLAPDLSDLAFVDQAQFLQHYAQLPSVMFKTEFLGTWGKSNGNLPLRTCPGCSVPEPYRSPDWALVSAKPA
jgi:hypothetical protein